MAVSAPAAPTGEQYPGKRIVVSINDQVAYFIEDDYLVKSHLVSTGASGTPTPLGSFSVMYHEYQYVNPSGVNQYYCLYYYNHLAFHSILYRPSDGAWIGGDTLGQKASHGCIRQTLENARWAYQWAPDGTKVDIILEHYTPPPPLPEPAQGGSDSMGIRTTAQEWFFADGSTAPGYDDFVLVFNPGPDAADVSYWFTSPDGSATGSIVVQPMARGTLRIRDILGSRSPNVSTHLVSDAPVIAERSSYFEHKPDMRGGSSSPGLTAPANTWYFAEGTCRPGFESHLCVLNPGGEIAEVNITYMLGDGRTVDQPMTVAPQSSSSIAVKDVLGEADDRAHDFSCLVKCTEGGPIVAGRPIYFNYRGAWGGGHDACGVTAPANTWYFAEGTCRPGFESYLCLLNPSGTRARVQITYMLGDASSRTELVTVKPRSRRTVKTSDSLGVGDDSAHDFSVKVESINGVGIVAERPMYFAYSGPGGRSWAGGHNTMGATRAARRWYLAEGSCRPGYDPYLCILNPEDKPTTVRIGLALGDGTTREETLELAPRSRCTRFVKDILGEGNDSSHDFSAKVESTTDVEIVVERPMYFSHEMR